jgi:hypothetical protein
VSRHIKRGAPDATIAPKLRLAPDSALVFRFCRRDGSISVCDRRSPKPIEPTCGVVGGELLIIGAGSSSRRFDREGAEWCADWRGSTDDLCESNPIRGRDDRHPVVAEPKIPGLVDLDGGKVFEDLVWNPNGGDTMRPGDEPGGQPAGLAPQSSQTACRAELYTHTRSDPSTAADHGRVPWGSLVTPATVPFDRISMTELP